MHMDVVSRPPPMANGGSRTVGEQFSQKLSSFIDSLFTPLGGDDTDWPNGQLVRPPGPVAMGPGPPGAPPPALPVTRDRPRQPSMQPSSQTPQYPPDRSASRNSRQMSRTEADYASAASLGFQIGMTPRPASQERNIMDVNGFMGGPNMAGFASASASSQPPPDRMHSPQPQPRPGEQFAQQFRDPSVRSRDTSAQKRREQSSRQSPGAASVTVSPEDGLSRTYVADVDDLLDQHVAYYFRHHPEVYGRHRISRKRPGIYELDGREIEVEWQYGTMPGEQGCLVAVDGPLRQPFSNYMENSEANAEYLTHGLQRAALHAVPHPSRMTFDDKNKAYTRLEAMKVAKEQAIIREKAAEYAQRGVNPPMDLRQQYEKTLARKLHPGGKQRFSNRPAAAPPSMMPGAPGFTPGVPAEAMAPPGPSGYPAVGHVMQGIPPMTTVMPGQAGPNLFGTPNLYGDVQHRMSSPAPGPPAFAFFPQ